MVYVREHTTTKPDVVLAAKERRHFVMAWPLDGVLCRLHLDGKTIMVARFKYSGHGSDEVRTEAVAQAKT